jgi:hypothetical protein
MFSRPGRPHVVRNDAPAVDLHRQPERCGLRPQPVPPSSSRRRRSPRWPRASRLRSGARAARRHGDARACATSRRTTAAGRSERATDASHRARALTSIGARSRRGGRPRNRRRRPPCRCAAACWHRARGSPPGGAPSQPAPSRPSDRRSKPSRSPANRRRRSVMWTIDSRSASLCSAASAADNTVALEAADLGGSHA